MVLCVVTKIITESGRARPQRHTRPLLTQSLQDFDAALACPRVPSKSDFSRSVIVRRAG